MTKALAQPGLSEIALMLAPFKSSRHTRSPSWRSVMYAWGNDSGAFGELREPVEWRVLPQDSPLRVVYLIDDEGPVIRWSSEDAVVAKALGGSFHEDLERGDGRGDARSGYIRVSGTNVTVQA